MRWGLGGALILAGLGVWWWGLRRAWRTLVGILQPRASGRVWDVLSRYTLMAHGKRVVVIGGGTGCPPCCAASNATPPTSSPS
jgi:hypothetical protein